MRCYFLLLGLVMGVFLTPAAEAHVGFGFDNHPASDVAFDYLYFTKTQDWSEAAKTIETASLYDLKERYLLRMKQGGLNAAEFRKEFRELTIARLSAMKPAGAYARIRAQTTKQNAGAVLRKLTLKLTVLSTATEKHGDKQLCHLLVRTEHHNGKASVRTLEIVSLVKVHDGSWKVTLSAGEPSIKLVPKKR